MMKGLGNFEVKRLIALKKELLKEQHKLKVKSSDE